MANQTEFSAVYRRAKTRVPAVASEVIGRPRLLSMLESTKSTKVLLIQAPAGYGKTSLLQQWGEHLARSGAAVAWLTPDINDQDPMLFLGYLVQALEDAGLDVSEPLRSIVTAESMYSWRMVATQLANSFVGASQPVYLCLDDLHHLKGSEALQCLQLLIDAAPPELRFVLASREDPGIPLGRLRATGQCVEVRTEHLRFDASETATYLTQTGHPNLTKEQLASIETRAEGWPVGLKLLSMALRWMPQQALGAPALSGEQRQIADFFAEDVLARQSQEMQDFLLRTCILDRICAALCDSLPGVRNSRALLDYCEAGGLFLISLDQTRTWYRYHQLFAEFLRRQLTERHPGLAGELYVAVTRWLQEAGFYIEAFDYALKGNNPIRAAEILDARCDAMWREGRQETFQTLATRLPPHVQALYPRIMLALAWRLVAQWRIDEARQLVDVSNARIDELTRSDPEAPLVRTLRWRSLHRESQIAQYEYQLESVEKLCRRLIEDSSAIDDPYTLSSVYLTLQYALREQFQFAEVPRSIEKALQGMQRVGFSHGLVFYAAIAGPSYFAAGRVEEAVEVLANGLAIARDLTGAGSRLGAIAAMHLSQILYERNDIELASELMAEYREHRSIGFVDQVVAGCITESRLARLRGDFDTALAILDESFEFAEKHGMPLLKACVTAEHVRALLRLARPDDAARAARRGGMPRMLDNSASRRRQTAADSAIALAWCRLAASQDRLAEAINVARRWRAHVTTAEAVHASVEWHVLLAELLVLSGDRKAAQRTVGQAMAHAAPARYIRIFVDEGEPIRLLLAQMAAGEVDAREPPDKFLGELLACFSQPGSGNKSSGPQTREMAMITGRMNTRELEILALAGSGMLNKLIGEKLGLTEGTVKWYLQQIFDKLGVRDRSRAAAKARQLGLIT